MQMATIGARARRSCPGSAHASCAVFGAPAENSSANRRSRAFDSELGRSRFQVLGNGLCYSEATLYEPPSALAVVAPCRTFDVDARMHERLSAKHGRDQGTEWLHVRVLEAKLAMNDEPKWLESNSVSGIDKTGGNLETSATGNRGKKLSLDQVKAALMYQLHERLQFVKPPDAIVGALLLDLGEMLGREPPDTGGALDVFKLASAYLKGLHNVDSLHAIAASQSRFAKFRQGRGLAESIFAHPDFIIAAGAILGILLIKLKRRIQRRWSVEKVPVTG